MFVCWMQDATTWMGDITHWTDTVQVLHWHLPLDLAQQFKQTDLAGDVGKAWNHFIKTGQVWAFVIGLILGYLFRSFTSYG